MRKVDSPKSNIDTVFEILRDDIDHFCKKIGQEYSTVADMFRKYEKEYIKNHENLSSFQVNNEGNDNQKFEGITKYYDNYYIGRRLYGIRVEMEKLVKNRCPICDCSFGYSQVTLDHILPKSKFPIYAITPINLVPTCHNCNIRKGTKVPSKVLHPYFHKFETFEYLSIEIEVNENDPCKSIIEVNLSEVAKENKEDFEDIIENINTYKLRQKYTDLSNIVFLKLMDEYQQVIAIMEDVYSINGLKKSFKCLDNFMDSKDPIVDENYLRHLCISAIVENDNFLSCLAKKLNIFTDYNARLSDSISDLKNKVQKSYVINRSNNLQIIKETLPMITFIGRYKLKENHLELEDFKGMAQKEKKVFKFKPSEQYLDSIKHNRNLSINKSVLLSSIEPTNKSGTEITIPLGNNTLCILLVDGLFDVEQRLLDDLALIIKEILI